MFPEYSYIFEYFIIVNVLLIFNVFIFYPVIIQLFAKIFQKPINKNSNYQPEVTIIISAYNEEKLIGSAIESIYLSKYNPEKIKVLVGSDGSTDRTTEILSELSQQYKSLSYYSFDRFGKNKVINNLVEKADAELIFFMDADLRIKPDTLHRLVDLLSGEENGIAMSSIEIIGNSSDSSSGGIGEKLYQNYELQLRKSETKIESNINSLGTFYGMKRELFKPIPNDKVCDDFFIILNVCLQKKRVIFDSNSITYEVREKSTHEEMTRRIRLVGGGLSTVASCSKILSPTLGWVSFFIWNHKVLRWFSPVYLLLIAISTVFLHFNSWIFYPIVILQGTLYLGALLGWIFEKIEIKFFITKIFLFIFSMNIGFLLGIIRFILGGENSKWSRTVSN